MNFFLIKDNIYKPLDIFQIKLTDYISTFKASIARERYVKSLTSEIKQLKITNNNLILALSKFNELNEILYEDLLTIPRSVGVRIIGNKSHSIDDNFIIDKGKASGITMGDYVISNNFLIGRVKSVGIKTSEVVSILSLDYGDEVLINDKSYIVSGTNKQHLVFVRQKNSTQDLIIKIGASVKIKTGKHYLILGKVSLMDNNFIITPTLLSNYSSGRVILND